MEHIQYEIVDRVVWMTFNRPKAYNALNREMLQELNQLIELIKVDDDVDLIVLTGEGKAFIAGADISEMVNMTNEEAKAYGTFGATVFHQLECLPKPSIAMINGFCLGGGNELAMACDFRIASSKAKFGQPEVSLGITPGFCGTQRLPRLIGISKAKELLYTGKVIDANEALQIGLVNQVVEPEDLKKTVEELVQAILKNSQYAVRSCKQAIVEGIEVSMEEALTIEADYFATCFSDGEQQEGMKAFLEKRPAQFK